MAWCSLNFITDQQNCSPASSEMLHQPHHLPPHKKGMKCMTTKEGFRQISSLNYLPQKATLRQPKMTLLALCDTSSLPVSLLPSSHPFTFHQLCILTLFPHASAGICLTCQPVLGAIPAEDYSTPSKRCFLLGQLPWISSLWARGLSALCGFASLSTQA